MKVGLYLNYSCGTDIEYVSDLELLLETRKEMKKVLNDIQTGRFTKDWMLENKAYQASFKLGKKL